MDDLTQDAREAVRHLTKLRRHRSNALTKQRAELAAHKALKRLELSTEERRLKHAELAQLLLPWMPMTRAEIAKLVKVHPSTVGRWEGDDPDFPEGARIGRTTYFSGLEVCQYLAEHRGATIPTERALSLAAAEALASELLGIGDQIGEVSQYVI